MNRTQNLTIYLCFFFGNLFAQNGQSIGETHQIYSNSLKQQIEFQIYLPKNYDEEDKHPTLYVLDGQWYFLNGVAIQESLRGDKILPKMIVVGINMVDRPYRSKLYNKWESFKEFIESELVSYVDNSYKTNNNRVVFGWENSGYLASELLLRNNSPFNCAIVASGASTDYDILKSYNSDKERYLFIAGSTKDIYSIDYTNSAAEMLASVDLKNLNWEYRLFNEEEHESMAYASMYQGLKFFYHNYGSLVFGSIDEFYEKGGIPYLKKYFKERGERFNVSMEIDAPTKNGLIWLAWKRDKFEAFDLLMTEFEDVLSTRRYANAYWQNRLAQYYLKYQSYDKAILFFNRGISEYPEDKYMAQMYAGLGASYLGKGDRREARKSLKKAVAIAEKNGDQELESYRSKLDELN